jgi:hypothetical protein
MIALYFANAVVIFLRYPLVKAVWFYHVNDVAV